jgi:hypothetical protein
MAVITFDVAAFRAAYSQFSDITDGQLENFWNVACLINQTNTDASLVSDLEARRVLLNMLVCHLCTLYQRGDGAVGTVSNATEGSVSTGFAAIPYTQANWWYLQTRCGAAYWMAMAPYRTGGMYFAYKHC